MTKKNEIQEKPGPTGEQLERLMGLEGKLLEVALEECDPDGWMNEEKAEALAKELDEKAKGFAEAAAAALLAGQKEKAKALQTEAALLATEAKGLRKGWKGERYWEKKNATATVSLLTKLELYRQRMEEGRQAGGGGPKPGEDEGKVAADIKGAEKRVRARLSIAKKRAC